MNRRYRPLLYAMRRREELYLHIVLLYEELLLILLINNNNNYLKLESDIRYVFMHSSVRVAYQV